MVHGILMVWHECKGSFCFVPQVVDGLSHVGRVDVVHIRQVFFFPQAGDSGMGDQIFISDGVSHPMEQFLCGVEQLSYPFGVHEVIAVGIVACLGEIAHVVVSIEQHHLVFVFFFIFCDFQKVPLQFLKGEIEVGVEVVADEDVDAVLVHEPFPSVASMDIADDVVGVHRESC